MPPLARHFSGYGQPGQCIGAPHSCAPLDFFKGGLPAAHALEELVELINGYRDNPEKDRDVWRRIVEEWGYQSYSYSEDFVGVAEGAIPD